MEKQLQDIFDNTRMPEDCADRIGQILQRRQAGYVAQPVKSSRWAPGFTAATAMLAMIFGFGLLTSGLPKPGGTDQSTTVDPEKKEEYRQEQEILEEELLGREEEYEKYQEVESLLITGLRYTEGNVTYWTVSNPNSTNPGYWYDTSLHSPFTEYVDGRVYFTANGERLDITNQFSMEKPFTYVFTDRYYIVHYIAIGGTPEDIGFYERRWKEWDPVHGYLSGFGRNSSDPETHELYGWYVSADAYFYSNYGI